MEKDDIIDGPMLLLSQENDSGKVMLFSVGRKLTSGMNGWADVLVEVARSPIRDAKPGRWVFSSDLEVFTHGDFAKWEAEFFKESFKQPTISALAIADALVRLTKKGVCIEGTYDTGCKFDEDRPFARAMGF